MNAHGQKTKQIAKRSGWWRMVQARWDVLKVRRKLGALRRDGMRLLKLHPVPAIIGAFVAGLAVMKLARHV